MGGVKGFEEIWKLVVFRWRLRLWTCTCRTLCLLMVWWWVEGGEELVMNGCVGVDICGVFGHLCLF